MNDDFKLTEEHLERLLFPSEEEVWGGPPIPPSPALELRLMGALHELTSGDRCHELARDVREFWLRGMERGELFHYLWPEIYRQLQPLMEDDMQGLKDPACHGMPHREDMAKALVLCDLSIGEIWAWVRGVGKVFLDTKRQHALRDANDLGEYQEAIRTELCVMGREDLAL